LADVPTVSREIRRNVMSELKGARAAAGCPELGNKTGGGFLS